MLSSNDDTDIEIDQKVLNDHRIDTLNILLYIFLLILTVVTVWIFKYRRLRYVHETGLAVIYGLFVGAILRYTGDTTSLTHLRVVPADGNVYNETIPPDTLWFKYYKAGAAHNRTVVYKLRGEILKDITENEIVEKATFDPEIFFNILLPPIIFNAGFSLKRKHFFVNLGSIFCFAFIGTTISAFIVGGTMYIFMYILRQTVFTFIDCLLFGTLISATDPVTILAIFSDLNVDVNLYALVFGESILNDAVAIVLTSAIEGYGSSSDGFSPDAFFMAILNFLWIFSMSFFMGSSMGCLTAILTKFTRLQDFPLLETALFVLMSYSTFLMAEAADLTGIVAVLFCGICQAHYTFSNLSSDSRLATKSFFELLNFLSENFIFCYIGVSMFTFEQHRWEWGFICFSFFSVLLARMLNIYPLSFLLNLGRRPQIPANFMHMLFFSGLRGAIAFALAIRNTGSDARKAILTTTSLIVIITVVVCGGLTTQVLSWLSIPIDVQEEETYHLNDFQPVQSDYHSVNQDMSAPEGDDDTSSPTPTPRSLNNQGKAHLFKIWSQFDVLYMKPFLTNSRPTLIDTMPSCCLPIARILTTTEQLTQERDPLTDDIPLDDDLMASLGPQISVDSTRQSLTSHLHDGDLGVSVSQMAHTKVSVPGSWGQPL